jgi:putative transposase
MYGGNRLVQCSPTDLTEAEWTLLAPLIPVAKPGGRPRTTDMREVVNAIFDVLRGGCQWRMLPTEFPPHQTVYHYFRTWRCAEMWERMHGSECHGLRPQGLGNAGPRLRAGLPPVLKLPSSLIELVFSLEGGRKRHDASMPRGILTSCRQDDCRR